MLLSSALLCLYRKAAPFLNPRHAGTATVTAILALQATASTHGAAESFAVYSYNAILDHPHSSIGCGLMVKDTHT